jgi:hypothetical protein
VLRVCDAAVGALESAGPGQTKYLLPDIPIFARRTRLSSPALFLPSEWATRPAATT